MSAVESTPTARVRISPFVGFEASGSDISNPRADPPSGYDEALVVELDRVGTRGGMVTLTPAGLRDLAEWCDAMVPANEQSDNYSGARALAKLAERCLGLARELEGVSA